MKIVSIVGARPQFIKRAPLSLELFSENTEFVETLERIEYVVGA